MMLLFIHNNILIKVTKYSHLNIIHSLSQNFDQEHRLESSQPQPYELKQVSITLHKTAALVFVVTAGYRLQYNGIV